MPGTVVSIYFFNLFFIVVNCTQHKMYYFDYFQVYNSVALIPVTLLCNHHPHASPELFSLSKLNLCTH